jgi:hypothetical protein
MLAEVEPEVQVQHHRPPAVALASVRERPLETGVDGCCLAEGLAMGHSAPRQPGMRAARVEHDGCWTSTAWSKRVH